MNNVMGLDGFVWWMGIIENRNDPLKIGRCQVRIFYWNEANKSLLPTDQLLWAQSIIPLNSTNITVPTEGKMVMGYFLDGKHAQHPMMMGWVPGIPDTSPADPSQGFCDPRSNSQLESSPRPPQNVEYNNSGSGVNIVESPQAQRFPSTLNQPMTSPVARNENLEGSPIQQRRNSIVSNIPTGTGTLTMGGIDLEALVALQLTLPTITIPSFSVGIDIARGFEICGLGIDPGLSAGFSFGGFSLVPPTITINGEILFGGIPLDVILAGSITLGNAIALAVDVAGCLLGGIPLDGFIQIDGGILLPLLPPNKFINISGIGIRGSTFGGVSLGNVGGIPLSSPPMWTEPMPPYNAVYPYNQACPTESGHLFEMDDTPGYERVHMFHRSGTFLEMQPDGTQVSKQTKHSYNITMADNNNLTMGDNNATINGRHTKLIQKDYNHTVQGNETRITHQNQTDTVLGSRTESITKDLQQTLLQNRFVDVKGNDTLIVEGNQNIIVLGSCSLTIKGSCTLAVAGTLTLGSTGDTDLKVGGNFNVNITGTTNIKTPNININSEVEVTGDIGASGGMTAGVGTTDQVTLQHHIHGTSSPPNPGT